MAMWVALSLGAASAALPETALRVDPGTRYQVIENFGASDCWTCDPIGREWSTENKERLADLLFSREKGIGLSLWRFNIGAGSATDDLYPDVWRRAECFRAGPEAPYDWSRQAGQQWFLRAARQRGVTQFLAFANSPPVWLTRNGRAHCDPAGSSTNLKPGAEPAFARFLADVLQHFREAGIPFRFVSPANEPNWDWSGNTQEGCRYGNDDLKRLIRALHTELRRRRLGVEILAPEAGEIVSLLDDALVREKARAWGLNAPEASGANALGLGKYREYVRDLLGDSEFQALLSRRICAHSYWTDGHPRLLTDLRQLVRDQIAQAAPGTRYWQTEYCIMEWRRDLGMDTALRVAQVIHHDLVDANASAWHWWLAVSPHDYKDGLIYTDYRGEGRPQNILPSKTLWTLGHYSRFIRPGARRVRLEPASDGAGLLASAYWHSRDRRLVVILTNASTEEKRVRLEWADHPRALRPYITTAHQDLAPQPSLPPGAPVILPPRSIVTCVRR